MQQQKDNRVAVVTGASSGIGQATAIRLAELGVGVIATCHHEPDGARETLAAVTDRGGMAVSIQLELGQRDTFPVFAARVGEALQTHWGRSSFDYLVNNAGFAQMALFEDMAEEEFDQLYRVLLKGPYFLTQQLLPLLADGGAIVNTASNSALSAGLTAGYSAYAAMKGGLLVLTRYLAKELSPRGIRVNAVSPGPTRTRLGGNAFERMPEVIAPLAARTALGRIGEPEDIGGVIAALLSDDCRWITAENIEVSGGFNL